MSLFDKLKEDRIAAFKAKETIKRDLLGVLLGESSKESKEPDDIKIIATIRKFIKGCDEIIDIDPLSVNGTTASIEKDILQSYLPKQLTEDEINDIISSNFTEFSIGEVMRFFKEKYEGCYNGAIVSKIVTKKFRGE